MRFELVNKIHSSKIQAVVESKLQAFAIFVSHLLVNGIDDDGSRLLQLIRDQGLSLAAVCCCHRDPPQIAVGPVYVTIDPIHCETLGSLNITGNHHLVVR